MQKAWTCARLFITDVYMSYYTYYNSPIGRLLMECDDTALTGLWIENQKYYARGADTDMQFDAARHVFVLTRRWLDDYFAGRQPDIYAIPMAPRGSDFQQRVWRALCTIPYGKTRTYADIARMVGTSPRAAGGAIGHNPISIIIPCHRVVGINGALVGYAGGISIKTKLLNHEN